MSPLSLSVTLASPEKTLGFGDLSGILPLEGEELIGISALEGIDVINITIDEEITFSPFAASKKRSVASAGFDQVRI
jgi:hypothetical protein